jgi:pimeloyl-ACP methyl ester carboxylesterase
MYGAGMGDEGRAEKAAPAPGALSPEKPAGLRFSRRRFLVVGLGGIATVLGAGAVGLELVSHGVVPGKQVLNDLDGACSVVHPPFVESSLGASMSGRFNSAARHREVGYTIAFPPGHRRGAPLPLVVMLHGYGANHSNALSGMSPAEAIALRVDGKPLAPFAMVTVDGGGGYWNPHPDDDPMRMVMEELIPMCQRLGLGRSPQQIGTMGISMGGFGALLLAEKYPDTITAVAAISPALWTTYAQARAANAGAFASAADFERDNVIAHASALTQIPVRVASGDDDPFQPGVRALAARLSPGAHVALSGGCHTGPFFQSQEPPSLAFLSHHLAS